MSTLYAKSKLSKLDASAQRMGRSFLIRLRTLGVTNEVARYLTKNAVVQYAEHSARGNKKRAMEMISPERAEFLAGELKKGFAL